jgi:hypothetical protein
LQQKGKRFCHFGSFLWRFRSVPICGATLLEVSLQMFDINFKNSDYTFHMLDLCLQTDEGIATTTTTTTKTTKNKSQSCLMSISSEFFEGRIH